MEKFDALFQETTDIVIRRIAAATPDGPALLEVKVETRGQGINLMHQFRQYWNALQEAREVGEITQIDPRERLAAAVGQLAIREKKGDPKVIQIVHRSQLVTARAIAGALGSLSTAISERKPLYLELPPVPKGQEAAPLPKPQSQDDLLREHYGDVDPKGVK